MTTKIPLASVGAKLGMTPKTDRQALFYDLWEKLGTKADAEDWFGY